MSPSTNNNDQQQWPIMSHFLMNELWTTMSHNRLGATKLRLIHNKTQRLELDQAWHDWTALKSSLWLISLLHYLSYTPFFCGLVSLMGFVFPEVFWKCTLIFTQSTGYVLMLCLGAVWNHNFLKGWNSLPISLLFIVHDPLEDKNTA